MAEQERPEKRPGPFAQDLSREPPTREQREKDYGPEKRDTGEALKRSPGSTSDAGDKGPARVERWTEDEVARAHLGGVKGSPNLKPAPLTRREAEQRLPNDDDGHPA